MLVCLAASVLGCWGFVKAQGSEGMKSSALKGVGLWWGIGLLLVFLALFRFNLIQFQAQSRYLHPGILPMALILAVGWRQLLTKETAMRAFVLIFGVVLLVITLWNAFGWRTLV